MVRKYADCYLVKKGIKILFNSLSANVGYTRHDAEVTCSTHSASYRQNH